METPSSTRRMTRSQAMAAASNCNLPMSRKIDESEKIVTKSKQMSGKKNPQDRSVLIDISNDSPIVGLAMGSLATPSEYSKRRTINHANYNRTPGSGEALLRGQVKTLLQKVEEEAEFSKITFENRPLFNLEGIIVDSSPINVIAPTPANTPQVFSVTAKLEIDTEMFEEKKEEPIESENMITKPIMLDFGDKSDSSYCSSVLSSQGESSINKVLYTDDENSSIWSIQANASSTRDDNEEEEDQDFGYEEEEEDQDYGDDGLVDEICEGISKICVNGAAFEGKHIRFAYNSDDEFEGEEEVTN